jgi:hypothetical protein
MATRFEQHPSFKDYLGPGATIQNCGFPWDRVDVTNAGEVLPCCFAQETLGNVMRDGLAGVLEGRRRVILQSDVAAGRLNSLCFNAPCPFARHSMTSAWTTFFPADRFLPHLGEWHDTDIACRPNRGDGIIFGGPHRFLPAAQMEATFEFSWPNSPPAGYTLLALATGRVTLEIADATGRIFAQSAMDTRGIHSAPPLSFRVEGYHRHRCEFRAHAQGVNFGFLFKGVHLSGGPANVSPAG